MSAVIEKQAQTIAERPGRATGGSAPAVMLIIVGLLGVLPFIGSVATGSGLRLLVAVVLIAGAAFAGIGPCMLQPNQAAPTSPVVDVGTLAR
ncbi:MAG TPA: hypothetical protein VK923_04510 [Euzebyales bacterium]|nr:hypothetical protein [Euzebyales bacterium]